MAGLGIQQPKKQFSEPRWETVLKTPLVKKESRETLIRSPKSPVTKKVSFSLTRRKLSETVAIRMTLNCSLFPFAPAGDIFLSAWPAETKWLERHLTFLSQ